MLSSKSSVNILTVFAGTRFPSTLKCACDANALPDPSWIAAIHRLAMPLGFGFSLESGGFLPEIFVANPCVDKLKWLNFHSKQETLPNKSTIGCESGILAGCSDLKPLNNSLGMHTLMFFLVISFHSLLFFGKRF